MLDVPLRGIGDAAAACVDLAAAPRQAARFYLRAWLDWADRNRAPGPLPVPWPSPTLAVEAALDETILAAFQLTHRPRPPEEIHRIEAEVSTAVALYEERGWLADPRSFFPGPPPTPDPDIRPARIGPLAYEHLSFESGYEPHEGEPGRDRWLDRRANRTAHAWVLRHPEPRPWLVCVHGAGMGHPLVDLPAFRAGWLHHDLGLNVALPVLPLHGPRREGLGVGAGFPTHDLLDTVHGVAQSVWDLRRLIGWLRREGAPAVGVEGLSLGSYTAAVLASVENDLACVIAGIPATDFAELFVRHTPPRFRRRPDYRALADLARRAHRVVSPLAIDPLVPRGRRFIYAGLADRMVHPHDQVRALWTHWDQPRIVWFEGSHIGFRWAAPVRPFVEEALIESGLTVRGPRRQRARNRPATVRAG